MCRMTWQSVGYADRGSWREWVSERTRILVGMVVFGGGEVARRVRLDAGESVVLVVGAGESERLRGVDVDIVGISVCRVENGMCVKSL